MSLYVYEQRYKHINFFENQSADFIVWMCPLLKPQFFNSSQFFYYESEFLNQIFFLTNGKAAFVLPRYQNVQYIKIRKGNHFGVMDIIGSIRDHDPDAEITSCWFKLRTHLTRQFSVLSVGDSQVLSLQIDDLYRMEQEYFDQFTNLIEESNRRIKNAFKVKLNAIEKCKQIMEEEKQSQYMYTQQSWRNNFAIGKLKRESRVGAPHNDKIYSKEIAKYYLSELDEENFREKDNIDLSDEENEYCEDKNCKNDDRKANEKPMLTK